MKGIKKLMSFLAVMAVSLTLVGVLDCQAAGMTNIATNQVITGNLATAGEEDFYVFTVDKAGYMVMEFSVADLTQASNVGGGWDVEIYNMNGEKLHGYYGIKSFYSTPKLPYAAGTQLYVKVFGSTIGINYKLKIKTVADASWEQEYNDAITTANKIITSVPKNGNIFYASDEDYFSYIVDRTGYFTLNFKINDLAGSADAIKDGWRVELFDNSGNLLYTYNGVTTNMSSQKLNFVKGTKIYVKVTPVDQFVMYFSYVPVGVDYSLTMNAVSKSNWEKETIKGSNDAWTAQIKNISSLSTKSTYGSLWRDGDTDIYKLSVPKTGSVTLKFNPNNVETNLGYGGYTIRVYNKKGEIATEYRQVKSSVKYTFNAKKGTYYVTIDGDNVIPDTDVYTIAASSKSFTVGSMTGKKISYKSSTATLKWSKVKHADGYEIQVCKNKNFKKSGTTFYNADNSSFVLPWTLAKGRYYVRIRAYRETITGDKIYGKFTKVKNIKKK